MKGQTDFVIQYMVKTDKLFESAGSSPEKRVLSLDKHSVTIASPAEKTVEHYCAQFSAMENMVAQMDRASDYLYQQLSKVGKANHLVV